MAEHHAYMQRARDLAIASAEKGTGPFGCVIVKDDEVIGEGWNQVTELNDPTAHAEIQSIRAACDYLSHFQLEGCVVYSSSYPCAMCLGALYWARPRAIYYSTSIDEATSHGFDDRFIFDQLQREDAEKKLPLRQITVPDSQKAFTIWDQNKAKVAY